MSAFFIRKFALLQVAKCHLEKKEFDRLFAHKTPSKRCVLHHFSSHPQLRQIPNHVLIQAQEDQIKEIRRWKENRKVAMLEWIEKAAHAAQEQTRVQGMTELDGIRCFPRELDRLVVSFLVAVLAPGELPEAGVHLEVTLCESDYSNWPFHKYRVSSVPILRVMSEGHLVDVRGMTWMINCIAGRWGGGSRYIVCKGFHC
jgi:hypothetical protein